MAFSSRTRRSTLTPFLFAALFAACSSKHDDTPNPQPQPQAKFIAHFELPKAGAAPDLLKLPFPSDLFLAADGTIKIPIGTDLAPTGVNHLVPRVKGAQFVAEALALTHGFGVYAGAIFALDGGAPDATKLPTGKAADCTTKDSPIVFFDVDAGAPVPCSAAWNDDAAFNEEGPDGTPLSPVLMVRTARGVVLPEGHKIAIVLTSAIVDAKGNALAAGTEFAQLRDGARSDDNGKLYGVALDAVIAKVGLDKARIVSAAVYTTGHVTDELRAARELARAGATPTLKWAKEDVAPVTPARFSSTAPAPDGWTATLDDYLGAPNKLPDGKDDPDYGATNPGVAHDAIAALGTAVIDAPNFLITDGDYGNPDHGVFFHDASGKVALNPKAPTAKVWVSFAVPKGAMPAKGWPVVVYQHGMAGQRGDMMALANVYASHGWATASIELVLSGTRGGDANARGDKKSDYKRSTSKYDGPDGFSDRASDGSNFAPNDLFGDLYRIAAFRDQFRQSAIDHTTLLRVLKSSPRLEGLESGAPITLDGSKVAYSGDSLGGIIGSILAGIEPDHAAYVLNVPGGAIFNELAPNSPNIYGLLALAGSLFFGYTHAQFPPSHPLVHLMQHVADGGDPIGLASTVMHPVAIAGNVPKARNVVLIEVLADELVSNEATEALARAMGIPVVAPHAPLLADLKDVDGAAGAHDVPVIGSTGALIQVFPAEHGTNLHNKLGHRHFAYPTHLFGDASQPPFPRLDAVKEFPEPYLEQQGLITKFIDDAFQGKAPTITWTTAPQPVSDK